jgi:hypothetical protein
VVLHACGYRIDVGIPSIRVIKVSANIFTSAEMASMAPNR